MPSASRSLVVVVARLLLNVCLLSLLLFMLFSDNAEGKVAGKRRVKAGAVDDSPTIVDKLWTYAKITLGTDLLVLPDPFGSCASIVYMPSVTCRGRFPRALCDVCCLCVCA